VAESDLTELVEKGARASSMKSNPIPLTVEEMTETLRRAI
jgi:hypothetical protein